MNAKILTYEDIARIDCALEMSAALVAVAGDVLVKHGDDPQAKTIMVVAFGHAIEQITEKIYPDFQMHVVAGLPK